MLALGGLGLHLVRASFKFGGSIGTATINGCCSGEEAVACCLGGANVQISPFQTILSEKTNKNVYPLIKEQVVSIHANYQ